MPLMTCQVVPSVLWHCWLGVRKSIRSVKIEWWVLVWLFGVRCRLLAYGPADTTSIPKPHRLLPNLNPDWFYLSGTSLPRLCWKRGHQTNMFDVRFYLHTVSNVRRSVFTLSVFGWYCLISFADICLQQCFNGHFQVNWDTCWLLGWILYSVL